MADWNQSILNKLKSMVEKGLSTAEIGKKLGITKNAVVGKLNRLGWNAKALAEPEKTKKTTAGKPASKSAVVKKLEKIVVKKKPEPKAAAVASGKKSSVPKSDSKTLAMHQRVVQHSLELANLRANQCRWPIGDPDSDKFHFCGAPVFVGKPYCYEHCRHAYQFAEPKKSAVATAAAADKRHFVKPGAKKIVGKPSAKKKK